MASGAFPWNCRIIGIRDLTTPSWSRSGAMLEAELLSALPPAGGGVDPLGGPLVLKRVADFLYTSFPSALGLEGSDRVPTGPVRTVPVAAPLLPFFAAIRGSSARARNAPHRTNRFVAKPSRLLARWSGRGNPPKTEPLAPDPKFPGPLGPGPAVLSSGARRRRQPRGRA